MAKTRTLTFTRTCAAPADAVYTMLTNSSRLRQWFCDTALLDARKGGRYYVEWNTGYYAAGSFLATAPGRKLTWTWQGRGEPAASQVTVTLRGGKTGARLTLVHSGLGSGKAWAKPVKAIARGWETALENLGSAFDTGEDLRISLRPMLGITFEAFDAAIARKLGTPVEAGVRLSDALPDMGAKAAGLQKDDVIVSIGGRKVTGATVGVALEGRRGGETVAVKFYRGSQQHTVKMLLSKRPLPEIPAGPAELAAAVQKIYADILVDIERALQGATDTEAAARPAPSEWSAREILCHLITGERGAQAIVAEMLDGVVRQYDGFGGNVEAQHAGLLAVRPGAGELLEALKRARRETVALLAAIPASLPADKSTWWSICFLLLQPPFHDLAHAAQIQDAIASARRAGLAS